MSGQPTVDCYIDCWEGSYRALLAPGVLGERYATHCYPFARRVLTINNVDDRREVQRLADAAIGRGECDAYVLVDEELPAALERCGLRLDDIRPVLHFVDFHLVTVATAQADYVLHVAGDVQLTRPFDWVSDAVTRLGANERFLIANPNFAAHRGLIEKESLRFEAPYWIGFGFSDQCFLGASRRLAAPIYGEWNLVCNRYPMTHIGRIFEARLDAYMRNHRLLRITDSRVEYTHRGEGATHFGGPALARLAHTPARLAGSLRWRLGGRRPVL
jgi:hypothetical protein